MRPTLRTGSRGEHVVTLQRALNAWSPGPTSEIADDGIFGMKTARKTRDFQGASGLSVDGVVGPNTWKALGEWVEKLVGKIPKPGSDTEAGKRIVAVAQAALQTMGTVGPVRLDKTSPFIAAAKCADPSDPKRPRQGGRQLQIVFKVAGAGPGYVARCPTISVQAEQKWQQQATQWRNAHDLPAWCGIFSYYVYRSAGIKLGGGWVEHGANLHTRKLFEVMTRPGDVPNGAIGVIDGIRNYGRNHHFIVVSNDPGAQQIKSIDGNAHGPVQTSFQGNFSVIARRTYSYGYLRGQDAYFLFPRL